ncbi:Hypothetical predicted protein [Cloeon dipterum]|uniref:Uncharacterized protein n=1 Tax=Cloeon dipterum TaxID=197152 RepID=A0A8S1DTZ9_9INSE|nr:Hypothetical predicted protein [Cloeon dipterum]
MSRIGAEFSQNFNLDDLWSALMWASNRRIGGLRVDKSIPEVLLLSEAPEGNLQRTPNDAWLLRLEDRRLTFTDAIDAFQKVQTFHLMVSAGRTSVKPFSVSTALKPRKPVLPRLERGVETYEGLFNRYLVAPNAGNALAATSCRKLNRFFPAVRVRIGILALEKAQNQDAHFRQVAYLLT